MQFSSSEDRLSHGRRSATILWGWPENRYSFAGLAVRDRFAADDLAQETFLHLWRRPSAFDPRRGNIKAYLFGIARKKAAGWWRRNRPHSPEAPETARAEMAPLAIRQALEQLPEDLRTVL